MIFYRKYMSCLYVYNKIDQVFPRFLRFCFRPVGFQWIVAIILSLVRVNRQNTNPFFASIRFFANITYEKN
jgi:hypothetical protein